MKCTEAQALFAAVLLLPPQEDVEVQGKRWRRLT